MGQAMIHIEARQMGRRAFFATNIFVREDQFDGLIVNHPHAAELNGMLTEMLMTLEGVELNLWKRSVTPTLHHLRMAWHNNADVMDFSIYSRMAIERSSRRERTKLNLMQTVKKVESFRRVRLDEIGYGYLKDFEQWLRCNGSRESTIHKELRNIRTLLNEALREGLIQKCPFANYPMPKVTKSEHTTLTEDELQRIREVSVYTAVRDAFLFCCRTGMRYSDYMTLEDNMFCQKNGNMWLVYQTVKTGVEVQLPIYLFGNLPHPRISSNSVANRQLNAICREAKVTKHISFHTARHTFATLMLSRGVPITTVQRMLGHTSVRMTERYAKTTQDKIENDVASIMKNVCWHKNAVT